MEPSLALGELDSRPSERVQRLYSALIEAGVRAEIPPDIQAALWEKFMLISTWGGIGAVTRAPIGVWRSTRAMAEAALREVLALAHACGVAVAEEKVATGRQKQDRERGTRIPTEL